MHDRDREQSRASDWNDESPRERHAGPGGAAATGAVTGGAIGAAAGPAGAAVGAVGGAIAGVAAERGMHADDEMGRRHREPGYADDRRDWTPAADDRRRPLGAAQTVEEERLQLREEELVAEKHLRDVGEVVVRTEIDHVPGRIEVEALREEVQVEHVPVGRTVSEREAPWEEGDTLIVPVYEEQLVVSKRLVLKEHLRVSRVRTAERHVFEDTLRKERLVVEDPAGTGLVHEQYPTDRASADSRWDDRAEPRDEPREGGFLGSLVRKALQ